MNELIIAAQILGLVTYLFFGVFLAVLVIVDDRNKPTMLSIVLAYSIFLPITLFTYLLLYVGYGIDQLFNSSWFTYRDEK